MAIETNASFWSAVYYASIIIAVVAGNLNI